MTMYSYTHLEKELVKSYRSELKLVKRPEEIEEIFSRTAINLLSKISNNVNDSHKEYVKLLPNSSPFYKLQEPLTKIRDVSEALSNSDLPAILNRFAEDAKNRYHHLIHDDDRTETFKKPPVR